MNIENSVDYFKSRKEMHLSDTCQQHEDNAILALEKQIPKKPNKFDGYQCPECGGKLARQTDLVKQHYCHHCGQALEW